MIKAANRQENVFISLPERQYIKGAGGNAKKNAQHGTGIVYLNCKIGLLRGLRKTISSGRNSPTTWRQGRFGLVSPAKSESSFGPSRAIKVLKELSNKNGARDFSFLSGREEQGLPAN